MCYRRNSLVYHRGFIKANFQLGSKNPSIAVLYIGLAYRRQAVIIQACHRILLSSLTLKQAYEAALGYWVCGGDTITSRD